MASAMTWKAKKNTRIYISFIFKKIKKIKIFIVYQAKGRQDLEIKIYCFSKLNLIFCFCINEKFSTSHFGFKESL